MLAFILQMAPKQKKKHSKCFAKYSEDLVQKALQDIKSGESKKSTARKYGIPRSTLQFRLSQKFKKVRKGPATYLTATEETLLNEWIIDSQRKGFPRRKTDIQASVQTFLNQSSRKTPFKDNLPGDKWFTHFLNRHPELTNRTAESVTSASANVAKRDIQKWFNDIESYLKEKNLFEIMSDPTRIFNGDETNFHYVPKLGQVIALRGSRNVYEVDLGDAKQNLTVMFTFSASGTVTPPMIIYPNKRLPQSVKDSIPEGWTYALTDNGWMKSETFLFYLESVLYPSLIKSGVVFPIVMFVDGHKTHVTYQVSTLCSRLQIIIIALYPNSTRILQPADVASFKPLKNLWRYGVLQWRRDHPFMKLRKEDFAFILNEAVKKLNSATISNGFKACGLFPWNANSIDYSKCLGKNAPPDSVLERSEDNPMKSSQEKVINLSTFKSLTGENKYNEIRSMRASSEDNNLGILRKLYNYLNNTNEDEIFTASFREMAESNLHNVSYTEEEIANMPIVCEDDNIFTDIELNEQHFETSNDPVVIDIIETEDERTNMNSDAQITNQIALEREKENSVSIEAFLPKQQTPERQGKRTITRMPYIITSSGFKKIVEEKEQLKKEEEERKNLRKEERLKRQAKIQAENFNKLTIKKKNQGHVRNIFGTATNETLTTLPLFQDKSVEHKLCFICVTNINIVKPGIKCKNCTRTYHVLCLKKRGLYQQPFVCATCLVK